jgi:hypothetical protein
MRLVQHACGLNFDNPTGHLFEKLHCLFVFRAQHSEIG